MHKETACQSRINLKHCLMVEGLSFRKNATEIKKTWKISKESQPISQEEEIVPKMNN